MGKFQRLDSNLGNQSPKPTFLRVMLFYFSRASFFFLDLVFLSQGSAG